LTAIPMLDCDLAHLVRTLRNAGYCPRPPLPWGPRGAAVRLVDADGGGHLGSVVASQYREDDGVEWLHASIAWQTWMPTYQDLVTLKKGVFGDRREAYQLFPPAARHVNIHAHALHLWGRADGARVLPDLGRWGTI